MAWLFSTEYKNSDQGTYYSPDMVRMPEEEARFKSIGSALAKEIEGKWLTGDRSRNSPDYPSFGSGGYPRLLHGWRWPIPDEPLRDRLKDAEGPLVDIISSTYGTWALSEKVIDLVEAIEPGVHQYLPYELIQPDGSTHPDRRWLLNICTRAEVVDTERSNIVWYPPPSERWFGDLDKKHLVLKAEEASNRALWCEWRYQSSPNYFASDSLWNALQQAGVRGWQPHFHFPHHMEEL